MGLNWLVTGGCGFIGSGLIARLAAKHEDSGSQPGFLRVVDDLSVGEKKALAEHLNVEEIPAEQFRADQHPQPGSCQLIVGNILDAELALRACAGVDCVVHLAANTGVGPSVTDPRSDCLNNVIGTFNYLEAARQNGVKRFVFASSGAPIGECEPPIHEELAAHPVSPYGASKLAGEGYCSAFHHSFGLDTVALRFGNVYGPGSGHKSSVVAKFVGQALRGETLQVFGDGAQTRDFIFINDLLEAIELAAERPDVGGQVFQIATSAETTVNELLQVLLAELERAGISGAEVEYAAARIGDVKRNFSDTSKAERLLGWRAATELTNGLRMTVASFAAPAAAA